MAKRKCKECNCVLELNEKNFRISNGYFAWKCRACMRKRSLALYYRNKKTNGKHPKLSEAKQHRKERVDAMMKKYRKIYNRLKRLGVNPDNPKYTAGDIDEILRKDGFEDVEQTSLNFNSVDISTIGVRIAV